MLRRVVLVIGLSATACASPQRAGVRPAPPAARIEIDAQPVRLNPQDPTATAIGEFRYAGGLELSSRQTDDLHELSGLVVTEQNRLIAVGDGGVLLDATLVLDRERRPIGIVDASLTPLIGEDGSPLTGAHSDAEGLALLPTGDHLVSFERVPRVLLYPASGGPPRAVPSPAASFPSNAGLEALASDRAVHDDAYVVGAEESGETWMCRVTTPCVKGPTVDKPADFSLVAMNRLPGGMTAYLLRAYDLVRRNRIILRIVRGTTVITELRLAPPMTVDNFEGLASVSGDDGRWRFYLVSDDNGNASQRTLLLAFDWQPRR